MNSESIISVTTITDNKNKVDDLVTIINRNVIDVTALPILKYGYRTRKASWKELVQIINIEKDIDKLSRSQLDQYNYEVFRYYMKKQYLSTVDYLLISKFNFSSIPVRINKTDDDDGEGVGPEEEENTTDNHDDDSSSSSSSNNENNFKLRAGSTATDSSILLVPNDFPYYVEDNVVHYVLWKYNNSNANNNIPTSITEKEINDAQRILERNPAINATEILYWSNPPHLKSIPEIDHVHFLCQT
ncbi:hypothetical protein FRACYDRAFT_234497 [Fragilariopsis cylindrus CCMP1102]|uniref:Uncharacterized protein n=1 Tax=Fragilariopsis cylindrus CCMP1102 TaxID=635003 RepID=A0A1E7FRY7_9STRA|nr:hypothetical protein FRACYDRAFT_234497 [Fragilariopsis cylindrus CCMP1102]|eukprot:OEU20865.1 hypothetical protein FRACYDRAFT_234497 [Fragilariopsis cylindrus CCMP1102]